MPAPHNRLIAFAKFGCGILLFGGLCHYFWDTRTWTELAGIRWGQAWQVLVLTLIINIFLTLRWYVLLGRSFSWEEYSRLLKFRMVGLVAGHSFSHLLGDLAGRVAFLKSVQADMKTGSWMIVVDKLFEVLLLGAVWGSVGVGIVMGRGWEGGILFFVITLLFFGSAVVLFNSSLPLVSHILRLQSVISRHQDFVPNKTKWFAAILTIMKYGCSVWRAGVILGMCGISLSLHQTLVGTAAAQLGLLVGLTPGGLGLLEGGWAGILTVFKIPHGQIALFLVGFRFLTFCSVLIWALGGVFWLRKRGAAPERKEGR